MPPPSTSSGHVIASKAKQSRKQRMAPESKPSGLPRPSGPRSDGLVILPSLRVERGNPGVVCAVAPPIYFLDCRVPPVLAVTGGGERSGVGAGSRPFDRLRARHREQGEAIQGVLGVCRSNVLSGLPRRSAPRIYGPPLVCSDGKGLPEK